MMKQGKANKPMMKCDLTYRIDVLDEHSTDEDHAEEDRSKPGGHGESSCSKEQYTYHFR